MSMNLLVLLAGALLGGAVVFAANSANYNLVWFLNTGGKATASSSAYQSSGTIGGSFSGTAASSQYGLLSGVGEEDAATLPYRITLSGVWKNSTNQ